MIDLFGRHATEKWIETSRRQRRMLDAFMVYAQKHPCDCGRNCVKDYANSVLSQDDHLGVWASRLEKTGEEPHA